MSRGLLSIVVHAYVAGALAYVVHLLGPNRLVRALARLTIGAGLLLQAAAWVMAAQGAQGMALGLVAGFSGLAWGLMALCLILDLGGSRPVFGAFLAPAALAVLAPAIWGDASPAVSTSGMSWLPAHVAVALAGMAIFTGAAAVAGMYLLMERQMKTKRFGLLFARLPSLQFLGRLNTQLVRWGFLALSLTLLTGVFFARPGGGLRWDFKEVATFFAWGVFALLVNGHTFRGWQGRRLAWGTVAGFAVVFASFLSNYVSGLRS
ncbi:MAG: inner membrane protein YpjD [Myxococcaceae bacterium]